MMKVLIIYFMLSVNRKKDENNVQYKAIMRRKYLYIQGGKTNDFH